MFSGFSTAAQTPKQTARRLFVTFAAMATVMLLVWLASRVALNAQSAALLAGLDAVDRAVQEDAQGVLKSIKWQTSAGAIASALLLGGLTFFVFLPGQRLLHRVIATSVARDRQLREAQTALDMTNHALRRKNEEIEKEQARLRRALTNAALLCGEQAAFTYSVSHDLKSPANTLQLVLDELIHEHANAMSDDGRGLLRHAQESITLMSILIEDVLQYSWATDPNEPAQPIDLATAVNGACEKLYDQINATDALITLGKLHQIKAAPRQIEILLYHLLSNALTFQPDGHIPNVHISSKVGIKPDTVVLRVEDNGIGIAAEDHLRVFGLFQRLHLRDTYPGSGLGLATCQRIAANHSGAITLQSALGEGSIFEVTLGPLLSQDAALPGAQAA